MTVDFGVFTDNHLGVVFGGNADCTLRERAGHVISGSGATVVYRPRSASARIKVSDLPVHIDLVIAENGLRGERVAGVEGGPHGVRLVFNTAL